MKKQLTVAVAGCGSRGQNAYTQILLKMPEEVRIVAAADPNEEKLAAMQRKCGLPDSACYRTAEDMLKEDRLADVMLICTLDDMHFAQAKAALEKGYHLLLEKPIAPTAEECTALAKLANEKQRTVVVCHVLRYAPFFQKIKEIIDSGVLGHVASIQGIEQVGYWHDAHSYVRGNWRSTEVSTPMILAKCCHDMDIMLWLTGKRCKRVSSFGSLMQFKPENAPAGAPARCTEDCPASATCPYNAVRYYMGCLDRGETGWPVNVVAFDPTRENVMKGLREGPYGRCVYRCDNDVVDHQVVNMELEDGATIDFSMCAFTVDCARRIHVMGTMGELMGDMEANTLRLRPFVGEEQLIDVNTLSEDFAGHGGGDARMVKELVDLLTGEKTASTTLTSIDRSVESHLVALAAEESRVAGGKAIELMD